MKKGKKKSPPRKSKIKNIKGSASDIYNEDATSAFTGANSALDQLLIDPKDRITVDYFPYQEPPGTERMFKTHKCKHHTKYPTLSML